jgi:hypothetical protein
MIREVAEFKPDRYETVFHWPMREALIAYRVKMVAAARDSYRHELLIWSSIAPHSTKKVDPPRPPKILSG